MYVDNITLPDKLQHGLKLGAVGRCTTHLVSESLVHGEALELALCVLIRSTDSDVADIRYGVPLYALAPRGSHSACMHIICHFQKTTAPIDGA